MARTYYDILGVSKSTSIDAIKTAYRKLAIKYHPDKNPDNPKIAETFMEISKAYETLSDPDKKKIYDFELSTSKKQKTPFTSQSKQPKHAFDLSSALHIFMKNMHGDNEINSSLSETLNSDPRQGLDIQIHIPLTLKEILSGCKKSIKVVHEKKCKKCNGTGSLSKKVSLIVCQQCGGKGKVRVAGRQESSNCNMCNGTGHVPVSPCTVCKCSGLQSGESTLQVSFAAGISEGNYVTIYGMGNAGVRGGSSGNLLVFIIERPDSNFIRKGYDIETEVTITLLTAVLGGAASIVDLDGKSQSFRIAPGTQPESLFLLKDHGLPVYKQHKHGSLYIRIHVSIPVDLSGEQMKLFKEFSKSLQGKDDNDSYRKIGNTYVVNVPNHNSNEDFINAFNTAFMLVDSKVPLAFDFTELDYIDSINIGKLIKISRKMSTYNEKLFLINANHLISDILMDCGLEKMFKHISSESELESERKDFSSGTNVYITKTINNHHIIYAGGPNYSNDIFNNNQVIELLKKSTESVGIDLSNINSVDSLIIGTWVKYYKTFKNNGGNFFLLAPGKTVLSILTTTNLNSLFKIYQTEEELQT